MSHWKKCHYQKINFRLIIDDYSNSLIFNYVRFDIFTYNYLFFRFLRIGWWGKTVEYMLLMLVSTILGEFFFSIFLLKFEIFFKLKYFNEMYILFLRCISIGSPLLGPKSLLLYHENQSHRRTYLVFLTHLASFIENYFSRSMSCNQFR